MYKQQTLIKTADYIVSVYDSILFELDDLRHRPATMVTLYRLEEIEKKLNDFLETLPINIDESKISTEDLNIVRDDVYNIKKQIRDFKYSLFLLTHPEYELQLKREDLELSKSILKKWRGNHNGINSTTTEN